MKVTILIPAYNEADRIGATITAALKISNIDQVVVINDGSNDQTAAVANRYPVQILDLKENRGKGQALNQGWQVYPADIYLLLDADLGHTAIYAQKLLGPVLANEADMVIANFAASQVTNNGKMGFGFAKSIARWGIKQLAHYQARSPLSGQRAVHRAVLERCGGFANDFGVEVALTITAARKGFRIMEVDVPMTHRATGRGIVGFRHRGRQLRQILLVLYRMWRQNV